MLISLPWLSFAFSAVTLAAAPEANANWGACRVDEPLPLPVPDNDVPDDELEIISGKVEFRLEGDAKFSDEIILRSGDRALRADGAQYDAAAGIFSVDGSVEFRDPDTRITAGRAEFNRNTGVLEFETAEFQLWAVPARGEAEHVRVEKTGKLRLRGATYTSCPAGKDDWMLMASEIKIDRNTGIGTAKNARLKFKGVPILYFPVISYPVTNQRKTGWLIPHIGSSDRRGFEINAPYYWNIAPQYDSTITPHYMSKRGLQLNADFRYLASHTDGKLTGEYLPDDDVTDTDRWLYAWFNQTNFLSNWRGTVDVIGISDSNYFEDMSSSLAATSQTNLRRHLDIEFFNRAWSVLLRFEDYQTIDPGIAPADEPYRKLPQVGVRGYTPRGLFGLSYLLESDVTHFDRSTGVTGVRGRISPGISWPINTRFIDLEPAAAVDHTQYFLGNTLPGEPDDPDLTVPILSFDATSVFERITNRRKWIQTLEPRALYTYIPFRDQDDLPVFDTIVPDLNVVQLFRRNRFVGYDRVGDTNQLAVGVTTRLIKAADGDEFLRATIGAIRYFSSRDVTLPGGTPSDSNSSDYLAEIGMKYLDNWKMRFGVQYDSDQRKMARTEARVLYQSGDDKIVNLSYRFRRDALEEVETALAWPLGGRWTAIGRYKYSIQDRGPLEGLIGLQYETCCWAVRANWRRNLATRDGEFDTSIGVQLLFKGLGSTDDVADELLDRGILVYD